MISVTILGFGNVGQHLYEALSTLPDIEIRQVYGRGLKPHNEKGVSFVNTLESLVPSDITLLAVKDDAIASVSKKLPFAGALVAHTSGSVPMETIDPKNRRAVFYPLQSFSKDAKVHFDNIPICIEVEERSDLKILEEIGKRLSRSVQEVSSEDRKKLHLAATWVNNFSNHLFHLAANYLTANNLSFDLLKPLILETANKVQALSPAESQTGPAIRRDSRTLENHLNLLEDPELRKIYKLLTKSIQNKNK